MSERSVLVLTHSEDVHASAVIRRLQQLGRPVFRLNTDGLLRKVRVSLEQTESGDTMSLVQLDGAHVLEGKDIGAVWLRRPAEPDVPAGLPVDIADHLRTEADQFIRWLQCDLDDRWWFNRPADAMRANAKILQHREARRAGLIVPPTWFGNDPEQAAQFRATAEGIVVKTLKSHGRETSHGFQAYYTSRVDDIDDASFRASVASGITFLQHAVPKASELRVTWVDGEAFVARIRSQDGPSEAKGDWRRVWPTNLPHERATLPPSTHAALSRLMRALKLRFGAIDMIERPDGELVFLECNTNGQWLWLDEMLDLGIATAIARALDRGCRLAAW